VESEQDGPRPAPRPEPTPPPTDRRLTARRARLIYYFALLVTAAACKGLAELYGLSLWAQVLPVYFALCAVWSLLVFGWTGDLTGKSFLGRWFWELIAAIVLALLLWVL